MQFSVTQLEKFYSQTKLGQNVRQTLINQIHTIWPDPVGGTLVGYGFVTPLLREFLDRGERVINLIPEQLGINHWPTSKPNVNVQVIESQWPIPSSGIERAIIMHGLEISDNYSNVLTECWRILAPEGQFILIVPNKTAIMSGGNETPFHIARQKRGFTLSQVKNLLKGHKFEILSHYPALFGSLGEGGGISEKLSKVFGDTCQNYSLNFGGVTIIVARKRVFLRQSPGLGETVKSKIEMLKGTKMPDPKPISGRLGS